MKRIVLALGIGVIVAGGVTAPATAAPQGPATAPQAAPSGSATELGGRAELIDILMEDHKGKGLSGEPRSGFGTPRKLSDGFPIASDHTFCEGRGDVPPACRGEVPPEGQPGYSIRVVPLLDVATRFRYHHRSIYVLDSEKRALVVQKETDSWRFLPIFEEKGVVDFVDFRIEGLPHGYRLEVSADFGQWFVLDTAGKRVGGGIAPYATDDKGRYLETTFSLRQGGTVLRQTTNLNRTIEGKKVAFPVVTDPWISISYDWLTAYIDAGLYDYEVEDLYYVLDSAGFQAFATALCGLLGEVPILVAVCAGVVAAALEIITDYLYEAVEAGCGLTLEWEVGVYSPWGYLDALYVDC